MGLCEVLPQQRDIIWFKVIGDYGKEEGISDTHIVIQDPDSEQVWKSVLLRACGSACACVCRCICTCVCLCVGG